MAGPLASSTPLARATVRQVLPNWAIAGLLTLAAGGSYYYTLYAVGLTDLDVELEKELARQRAIAKE